MSTADELIKWKQLLDDGVISPEQFERRKVELLRDVGLDTPPDVMPTQTLPQPETAESPVQEPPFRAERVRPRLGSEYVISAGLVVVLIAGLLWAASHQRPGSPEVARSADFASGASLEGGSGDLLPLPIRAGMTWDECQPYLSKLTRISQMREGPDTETLVYEAADERFRLRFERPAEPAAGPYRLVSVERVAMNTEVAVQPPAASDGGSGTDAAALLARERGLAESVMRRAAEAVLSDDWTRARGIYTTRLDYLESLKQSVRRDARLSTSDRAAVLRALDAETGSIRRLLRQMD